MSMVSLSGLGRAASAAPVIARIITGVVLAYHGYQKLLGGASAFAGGMLEPLGIPAPTIVAYLQIFAELAGGIALIIGLLSRFSALVNAVILVLAIFLVKLDIGLIAPGGAPLPGAELDLGLLAGLFTVMLLGPGKPSVDHAIGIEKSTLVTARGTAAAGAH